MLYRCWPSCPNDIRWQTDWRLNCVWSSKSFLGNQYNFSSLRQGWRPEATSTSAWEWTLITMRKQAQGNEHHSKWSEGEFTSNVMKRFLPRLNYHIWPRPWFWIVQELFSRAQHNQSAVGHQQNFNRILKDSLQAAQVKHVSVKQRGQSIVQGKLCLAVSPDSCLLALLHDKWQARHIHKQFILSFSVMDIQVMRKETDCPARYLCWSAPSALLFNSATHYCLQQLNKTYVFQQ